MKRIVTLLVLAGALATVASASAEPGNNNPNIEYRTFSCSNGVTYTGGFVGISANFFLVGSTNVFVFKEFTTYLPSGPETFNYGIKGFDPSTLLTCSYTDPDGNYNVLQGFITPAK
jgi:hypothetical protein